MYLKGMSVDYSSEEISRNHHCWSSRTFYKIPIPQDLSQGYAEEFAFSLKARGY